MPQLCLSIAPQNLSSFRWLKDRFDLFLVTKVYKSRQEHGIVQAKWSLLFKKISFQVRSSFFLRENLSVPDESLSEVVHDFFSRSLNIDWIELKNRVVGHKFLSLHQFFIVLFSVVDHLTQFLHVKRSFFEFSRKNHK